MKVVKDIIFYILSFTWGILMSLIGLITAIALLITGHKPCLFHNRIHFKVGDYWGGLEMGPIFITDNQPNLHIKQHECGHGIQNIILGPFMPFVVSIPSAIRYWLREMKTQKSKYLYSVILCIILWSICIGLIIIGKFFWIPLSIIGGSLLIYSIIIFIWLIVKEIPKYKNNTYVSYDSIWFEGTATKLGEKYFPTED